MAAAIAALAAGLSGCSSASSETPLPVSSDLSLTAHPPTVQVRPGERGSLSFTLQTVEGAAVPGQRISFVIVDDSGQLAQGATLSADSALTDGSGTARVDVNGGRMTVFSVRASAPDPSIDAETLVVVSSSDMPANVQVAPLLAGETAAADIVEIDVSFYDGEHCAGLPLGDLPMPGRPVRILDSLGDVAEFDLVSTSTVHAVTGRAYDRRGAVKAQGCVDLPGTTLVAGDLVRVSLPLPDASPSPVGQFDVTSRVTLADSTALPALIAAPWVDLQDCPLDPAQLWLDCTIDALSGAVAGDPIDCRPQDGAEGPLGALLVARRGVLLLDANGNTSACRGSHDATGAPSHDGMLDALFGAPKPAALVGLHGVAADAATILSALTLGSRLHIADAPGASAFLATHTFMSASFGAGTAPAVVVHLLPLGLPALEASFIPASDSGGVLTLDLHRITLRLGTVARAAFGQLLARRGLPVDSAGAVGALVQLAASPLPVRIDQATMATGCAALDALLCADVGQARGCLLAACNDGLAALAARLDAGFALADGEGLDLDIEGSAPIIDSHGSGSADHLGDTTAVPPQPGTWTATLHARAGDARLSATWDAFHSGN